MKSSFHHITLRRTTGLVTGSFAVVLLGVLAVAGISRHYAAQGIASTRTLTENHLPNLVRIGALERATLHSEAALFQFAMASDEAKMNEIEAAFLADLTTAREAIEALSSDGSANGITTELAEYRHGLEAYATAAAQFRTGLRNGDFEGAMQKLDQDVSRARSRIAESLQKLADALVARSSAASQATADSISESARVNRITVATLACCTIAGLVIAVFSVRAVARMVRSTSDRITESATIVRQRASLLVSASQALADGSSEQAASLEESSASLEEIAGMTRHNADSAKQAESVSHRTRDAAESGAGRMQAMNTAMDAIRSACEDEIGRAHV